MSAITRYRKPTVLICGVFSVLITLLLPPTSLSARDGDPCFEHNYHKCKASESQCVDCNEFCETKPGCIWDDEWEYCQEDEEYCPDPAKPVLNECACKSEVNP